jgi:hypothetical protein
MIPGPQQHFVMAANAAYSATQGDLIGAALSAVGAYGGFSGAGSAVKAVSGPLKGQYVIPGVMNTAQGIAMPASNTILGAGNLGRAATPFERVLADAKNLQSKNRFGGAVGGAMDLFGGQQQQQAQQQLTPEQLAYLQQVLAAQQRPNGNIFSSYMGVQNRAKGGRINGSISELLMAQGGMATGRMVQGHGDGMSDSVPAVIDNKQPAALSDGEHVVPALQVAMLGRGSSKAGSKRVADIVLKEIEGMYGKGANPKRLQDKAMKK